MTIYDYIDFDFIYILLKTNQLIKMTSVRGQPNQQRIGIEPNMGSNGGNGGKDPNDLPIKIDEKKCGNGSPTSFTDWVMWLKDHGNDRVVKRLMGDRPLLERARNLGGWISMNTNLAVLFGMQDYALLATFGLVTSLSFMAALV